MNPTIDDQNPRPKSWLRLASVPILLSLALALAACSSTDAPSIAEPATTCLEIVPDVEVACGQLTVPADHDEPDGATFSLPYVVLPALGDNPAAEPLVYLQGGPGESTMTAVPLFVENPEFRQDRHIVFLEQRGTDPTGLFLRCDQNLATFDDLQECYDGYVADGVDLSAFTTLNAAKDLALLRAELGVEQWHLLGASYGTTLAMVAMDNDPGGTASVILDGPTAPDVIIYNADSESQLDAFSNVFNNCAADPDCSSRNTDLFDTHLANYQRLFDEPWDVMSSDLAEVFGPTIDHDAYLGLSIELLQGQPGALPAFITAIANRDAATLLEFAEGEEGDDGTEDADGAEGAARQEPQGPEPEFAAGLNHSVYCAEEAPYFDLETNPIVTVDEWPAGTAELLLPPVDQMCEIWKVDPADPSDVDQIVSAIPTLILAGEYDALTPLRQGEIAAAGLSESELIEVPSTGHTTLSNGCARSIMVDFLRSPGGDRSCLADIAPIVWW